MPPASVVMAGSAMATAGPPRASTGCTVENPSNPTVTKTRSPAAYATRGLPLGSAAMEPSVTTPSCEPMRRRESKDALAPALRSTPASSVDVKRIRIMGSIVSVNPSVVQPPCSPTFTKGGLGGGFPRNRGAGRSATGRNVLPPRKTASLGPLRVGDRLRPDADTGLPNVYMGITSQSMQL